MKLEQAACEWEDHVAATNTEPYLEMACFDPLREGDPIVVLPSTGKPQLDRLLVGNWYKAMHMLQAQQQMCRSRTKAEQHGEAAESIEIHPLVVCKDCTTSARLQGARFSCATNLIELGFVPELELPHLRMDPQAVIRTTDAGLDCCCQHCRVRCTCPHTQENTASGTDHGWSGMDDRFGASQLAQHNETLQTSLDLAEALRQRHLHMGTH